MNTPIPPPPPIAPETFVQSILDAEHLRLLKYAYYVAGVVTALTSCIFIFHFLFFLVFGLNPQFFNHANSSGHTATAPPPPGLFLGLAGLFGVMMFLGWIFGALQVYAGRCLRDRQHPTFVMVIAAIECVFLPWGTALGIFTFLVLNRPSVQALLKCS